MIPLNLASVLWVAGTPQEIDNFISNAEMKHGAVKIGHQENVRDKLVKITTWSNLEYLQPYIRNEPMEAAFLLMQGQIIGCLVQPNLK